MPTSAIRRAGLAIVTLAIIVTAVPVSAQGTSELERPDIGDTLTGTTRGDGVVVLADPDWCSYLFGALWGTDELTFSRLIDRSPKQRKARKGAFAPVTDAATLERCAAVLAAYRVAAPPDDPLPSWARGGPVVPDAVASVLVPDLATDPLATPPPIGDGARTSGFGSLRSAPFGLPGGVFYAAVDAGTCPGWSGTLRGARNPAQLAGEVSATTYLYGVAPGFYFWDVQAPDCDWSVDLVPVDMGPEPTPTPGPTPTPVPTVEVPSVIGPDPSYPLKAFTAAGLVLGTCTEVDRPPYAPGSILEQSPKGGTIVEVGSAVDVVVRSPGCDLVTGAGG
jgi:hypothetical protein